MHSFFALILAVTLWQPPTPQAAADETAIRAIVAAQAAAWNAGDAKGYGKDVSPDVSFTNLFGMVMYGRDAFVQRHTEVLSTFYKGTTKVQVVRRVRFLTPDVAIVDIDDQINGVRTLPGGIAIPKDGVIKTQLMEIFARRQGQWWIEAYHSVDVKRAD